MSNKKRITIFAAYDSKKEIKKYVLTYLLYLRELSDFLIFISDCDYSDYSKKILGNYVDYFECHKHGEYDFGSYKRGINYLINKDMLYQFDELIICNDSCLCLGSLKKVFNTMSFQHVDFWGMTQSFEFRTHLQSFFLVFKKNVFTRIEFRNYFNSVEKKRSFGEIVASYELPLMKYFNELGFKSGAFFSLNNKLNPSSFPKLLLNNNCPLIKKKIFLNDRWSKNSVLFLLLRINKEYKQNITDILELYKNNSFYKLILELCFKKIKNYLFSFEVSKRGETRFKIFNIPIINLYQKKDSNFITPNLKTSIICFLVNLFIFRFLFFKTRIFGEYFYDNEEWGLSKLISYKKNIAIYGFGPYGQDFFVRSFNKYIITGIYDINYKTMNCYIKAPDEICIDCFDYIVVTVMEKKTRNSVIDFLHSKGIKDEKIILLNYKVIL